MTAEEAAMIMMSGGGGSVDPYADAIEKIMDAPDFGIGYTMPDGWRVSFKIVKGLPLSTTYNVTTLRESSTYSYIQGASINVHHTALWCVTQNGEFKWASYLRKTGQPLAQYYNYQGISDTDFYGTSDQPSEPYLLRYVGTYSYAHPNSVTMVSAPASFVLSFNISTTFRFHVHQEWSDGRSSDEDGETIVSFETQYAHTVWGDIYAPVSDNLKRSEDIISYSTAFMKFSGERNIT